MKDIIQKLKLPPDNQLKLVKSISKGFMDETDISNYEVIDSYGNIVGTVEIEDHTSIRGLRTRSHIIYRDTSGKIVSEIDL